MEKTRTRTRRWGIGRRILAVLILASVLASGLSGIVLAQDGPAFATVTLSASSVARGGTVTVSAHITDSTADVLEAPTIFFLLPDGADGPAVDFALVSGDARDGHYDATVTISPLLPPGKYAVKLLRAYDGDGYIGVVMPPDPRLASLALTVTGDATASTPANATDTPVPSATMNPTTTATPTATPGANASATATVMGTRFPTATGTRAPTSTASRPTPTPMFTPVPTDGPGPDIPSTTTPTATIAVRVTVLPTATTVATTVRSATPTPRPTNTPNTPTTTATTAPPATASPRVTATTTAKPTVAASSATPRATSTVAATAQRTAVATMASTGAAPVLASLTVSDVTVYPGDALIVTARITDSTADVADFPTLRYRLPDGSDGPFAYLRRTDGTARDGTYQAIIGLSPFFPPGTYTIAALTISDVNGNTNVVTAPMPAQPDATFIVQPFVPPTPTPFSSDAG